MNVSRPTTPGFSFGLLEDLRTTYEKHIAVEDNQLFPLAEKTLDRAELEAIAQEMAARRGLVFGVSTSQR